MIDQLKVTQPLSQDEPPIEMLANDCKSFSVSVSCGIVAHGGLRWEGSLSMQQTQQRTFHPVPPRATRGTQTEETVKLDQTAQVEEYPVKPLSVKQLPGHRPRGVHWTLPSGTTMLLTLIALLVASAYVVPFCVATYQHWQYGDARISQLDATIDGRHDHFTAQTLNSRVIVIDLRNSDAAKAQVFVSPQRATIDHAVITLQKMFIDGHDAVIVQVEGQQVASILYSVNDTFAWDIPPTKK